ncbi:c-type cytochrome [Ahniella affigens]|nr:cytochrome c [Ahniella affigens]
MTSSGLAQATNSANADPGRAVYDAQHCVRCHALAGKGNRLRPLDDVGLRLDAAAIRDRVTAGPSVADQLDKRALMAKQKFARLPSADLDALIAFLVKQQAPAPTAPK